MIDIKSKFMLYSDFIRDHIADHCSEDGKKLLALYGMSFSMLSVDFIVTQINTLVKQSNEELCSKNLYNRLVKTFQIREEELSEDVKTKFMRWLDFVVDVCENFK